MSVDVESIKDEVSVYDLLTELGATVRRDNMVYCPFCNDQFSRNPGAHVYADGERYHCFVCDLDGDVITLAREHTGLGFKEACEWLMTTFVLTV